MRREVTVYIRIEGQEEVPVGTARNLAQIPVMLRNLADRWEDGLAPDVLEEPPPPPASTEPSGFITTRPFEGRSSWPYSEPPPRPREGRL
ncbi:MAG: hypothetical protein M3N52_12060 [Actinomycetota bacterium]|nr:hypothetical protein [Actinomycetota bacterium]